MKFSIKVALAIVTAAIISPIAANANPVVSTGSTAAAVSIKFNDCRCGGNGGFSITPGGNTNGGGAGVKELSAAVATGETSAIANSASTKKGTTAHANGYSTPVSFTYYTSSDIGSSKVTSDYTTASEYVNHTASQSAMAEDESKYAANSTANKTTGTTSNGTKGTGSTTNIAINAASGGLSGGGDLSKTASKGKGSSTYSASSNTGSGKATNTASSTEKSSSSESANAQHDGKSATVHNTSDTQSHNVSATGYTYTGTSAGLSLIPIK